MSLVVYTIEYTVQHGDGESVRLTQHEVGEDSLHGLDMAIEHGRWHTLKRLSVPDGATPGTGATRPGVRLDDLLMTVRVLSMQPYTGPAPTPVRKPALVKQHGWEPVIQGQMTDWLLGREDEGCEQ